MSAPTVRVPATDAVDHRARAYNAAQALVDLTQHLDPRLRVTLQAIPQGTISALLHDGARADATELAHRLGLTEHTECPSELGWMLHRWAGRFAGHACQVDWFDETSAHGVRR